MSKAWAPPRTADELPDDDHECAYRITGGLYDGAEIGRRERKLWPERRCPPRLRKDPEFTARFHKAVLEHDKELNQIMADVESGKLKLSEISDEEIIAGLHALAKDKRRPSVQLQALKTLAEMRGLIKNADAGAGASDDQLEQLLADRRAGLEGAVEAGELSAEPPD